MIKFLICSFPATYTHSNLVLKYSTYLETVLAYETSVVFVLFLRIDFIVKSQIISHYK